MQPSPIRDFVVGLFVLVEHARIYGGETQINFNINENWSLQAGASYNDSRVISTVTPAYQAYVNERLPFAPYFSWSWNARYEHPLGTGLRGYAQFDMAHKGDMYNGLNPNDPTDGAADSDNDGYTNVEEFLNRTNPNQFVDYKNPANNKHSLH